MVKGRFHAWRRLVRGLYLTLRVHLDALLGAPSAYVTAAKWWLLRKRVRARGQFAPLLGRSPRAYELWAMREERWSEPVVRPPVDRVLALIAANGDEAALAPTLASLAAAEVEAIVLGASPQDALHRLAEGLGEGKSLWLMPILPGDVLAARAGARYRSHIMHASSSCTIIFADDDIIDERMRRKAPHFKPDWNSELFAHHDFLVGACIVRADGAAIRKASQDPQWARSLVASVTRKGTIEHLHAVLHHRVSRPPLQIRAEPLRIAARLPSMSVIIPTRNRANLLRTCISGLRATRYPALEIIVANNDSDEPETLAYLSELADEGVTILYQPGPFNYSTINNHAVAAATGELLCLMNNDIEVLSPDWLAIMATQAMRPEVGAVGAQLLYPDGRIQHAGVVIGVGNAAGHAHRFLHPEAEGYFRRHALPQFVSAVTGACLVVRREKFLAVGGLDEANFAVAFNDVDLCLKLNARGWQSFYEPRAVLVHHESVSRGLDTDPVGAARFAGELAALQRIWRTHEIVDPYHHPMLSRASEQFALDLTSTIVRP